MTPEQRDPAYLWDMLEAARDATEFVRDATFERFTTDKQLRYAVERAVTVIGEAARRISGTFKRLHPEIPWSMIVAQRNVVIHEYDVLELQSIWEVATVHAPALVRQLEPLIPPLPPTEE
jgi:uncharacterized protein with HEPN domain